MIAPSINPIVTLTMLSGERLFPSETLFEAFLFLNSLSATIFLGSGVSRIIPSPITKPDVTHPQTETPIWLMLIKSWALKPNQIEKCHDVDLLIFVETPSKYNGNSVKIYEIPKDKRQTKVMKTKEKINIKM